ncbi:hypothetical protein J3R30DRAFT_2387022 [Lentinula aciculospora]|uniref:Uncharacterized protein n=1 Tax=Lentinula aciculospora TaxID=153920 RepID=A0A9W9AFT0_9AGAR|nr:hypothetical protein J3R30DRAFT_2387022 [Lentinula aciculospora]
MLPPALLDYTISRISSPYNATSRLGFCRHLASAALALKTPQHVVLPDPTSTRARNRNGIQVRTPKPLTKPKSNANAVAVELARRVRELEKVTDEKDIELDPPVFSEEDLLTFYEDILAHPDGAQEDESTTVSILKTNPESQYHQDLTVLEAADSRLGVASAVRQSSRLTALRQGESTTLSEFTNTTAVPVYYRVVNHLGRIVQDLERVETGLKPNIPDKLTLPIPLLSKEEWNALIRAGIHIRDTQLAEKSIEIMKRCNLTVPEEHLNAVLQLHVDFGDIVGFESCLERLVEGLPTSYQRHLHIKTHILSTPQHLIPASALSVLHAYELKSTPAPMKTYTSIIHRLLSVNSFTPSSSSLPEKYTSPAVAHAQAWDLFSHMRYVAHPVPDAVLYTQMIRACASSLVRGSSDPERALDLFTEMTVDHNMAPIQGTWGAVILACARFNGSSTRRKKYVNEAFRLAREMLDSHRDAYGRPAYVPDKKTFCALLEGAKRIGELGRVRWILAEMVRNRSRNAGQGSANVEVDEEVMMHVFHAYAAYRPPFRRSLARVVNEVETRPDASFVGSSEGSESSAGSADPDIISNQVLNTGGEPAPDTDKNANASIASSLPHAFSAFSHVPPQTSSEVIAEVDILFDRILHETGASRLSDKDNDSFSSEDILNGKFSTVKLTPHLLNSYLSTYYNHSSLEASRALFWRVFGDETPTQCVHREAGLGIQRDARTYVEALERCAISKKAERALALKFAEELFDDWREIEILGVCNGKPISPRIIERVHVAWIRMLTLTDNIDRALSHLRTFVSRYPSSAIRPGKNPKANSTSTMIKPTMRSTRTSLVGARPLVRLTSPVDVPETGQIPPLMMWSDLEVLHHRVVAGGVAVGRSTYTREGREKREKDLAYIKWVCKSYEWALRVRRDEAMRARPEDDSRMGTGPEVHKDVDELEEEC